MRQRYERMFRERQKAETTADGSPTAVGTAAVKNAFQGAISSVFAKHLQ